MISKNMLISHRLRGFDVNDATEIGLRNALSSNINAIEFDTRITKDEQIVINHDPHLFEQFSKNSFISHLTLNELKSIPFNRTDKQRILTLEEFIGITNDYKEKDFTLYLDIKQFFKLDYIYFLLTDSGLLKKTIIVSWLPEVLGFFHSIDKNIRLCFSFIPVSDYKQFVILKATLGKKFIRSFLTKNKSVLFPNKVFTYDITEYHFNDYNNRLKIAIPQIDLDFEHFVYGNLSGELLSILKNSHGIICIPAKTINREIYAYYKEQNIQISLFTVNTLKDISELHLLYPELLIMTDNAELFTIIE